MPGHPRKQSLYNHPQTVDFDPLDSKQHGQHRSSAEQDGADSLPICPLGEEQRGAVQLEVRRGRQHLDSQIEEQFQGSRHLPVQQFNHSSEAEQQTGSEIHREYLSAEVDERKEVRSQDVGVDGRWGMQYHVLLQGFLWEDLC